jgi:HNH endonuclease
VPKQSLHGFWIGSDADEKRREAMAQIMKTELSWVIVDQLSSDVERVSAFKWFALVVNGANGIYAVRNVRKPDGRWTTQYLHRFLLNVIDSEVQVDHRDGNALNSTRSNLRTCTRAENLRITRKRRDGLSRFKGVSREKRKWKAEIQIAGQRVCLGRFQDEHCAALAYDDAARKYFKEMLESLRGHDRHAAMPKMGKFADANLDEIQEQMQKIGLTQQSQALEKAQAHAKSLVGAYDVANGKYLSSVYRLFMHNPKQAWPGIAVMMATHAMGLPFPAPQIAGAMVAAGHIGFRARGEAGRVGHELKTNLPPEFFRTRTPANAPETFSYKDPDQGWTTPTGGSPSTRKEVKAAQLKRAKGRR